MGENSRPVSLKLLSYTRFFEQNLFLRKKTFWYSSNKNLKVASRSLLDCLCFCISNKVFYRVVKIGNSYTLPEDLILFLHEFQRYL